MKENKMDAQSLNGEEQRSIYSNSDLLTEKNDPVINGSNKVATKKGTLVDNLIEKSDDEIIELIQPLNSEERIQLLDDINKNIMDFESVVRLLIHMRSICGKQNESMARPSEIKITNMIEKLKRELLVNPEWTIIEEAGEFYAIGMYNAPWHINVKLRQHFPKSYFHGPAFDDDIIGYDAFTGAIIYNLWQAGRTEMDLSEASDFHDTGYGIGRVLSERAKYGFGDKVPPIYILSPNYISYHSELQGSMYHWGYDVPLINDIGRNAHFRLSLKKEIESEQKFFEEYSDKWTEEFRIIHQKTLEELINQYNSLELMPGKYD